MNILSGFSDPVNIILMILIIGVLVFLSWFLFKRIKVDFLKEREDKDAFFDGLYSKSAIHSFLATYMNRVGSNGTFSLIYIDLDKFEDFANAFGQKEAKKILETYAARLKSVLPNSAKVSRYEGDEFLIFLPNDYERYEVLEIAKQMQEELKEEITLFGQSSIVQTPSIAISFYPMHGGTIKDLLQSLKLTVYQIKKAGGNDIKIYQEGFEVEEEFIEYYYQIKHAIEKKEFQLYYQPMEDGKEKTVYGFEALIRWNHPTLGVLAPNRFINIMEQSGDIHWVGQWGLETIIKAHHELKLKYPGKQFKLSFNLSPKQLMNESLASSFQNILKRVKVPHDAIILEVNEYALFNKQDMILENIKKLKALGFMVAIDGLGLDLASFEMIEKLDIDVIKIDLRPVEEVNFVVLKTIETLVEYASKKGTILIGEGVETKEDLDRLSSYGIHIAQGYFYSKPIAFEEIETYLSK